MQINLISLKAVSLKKGSPSHKLVALEAGLHLAK